MNIIEKKGLNKMVLYSVITTYQLLESIVHKLNYNKNEKAILMMSQWCASKYPWYKELTCFFEKVIIFEGHYTYSEALEDELNSYFGKLFLENQIEINNFNQIHLLGAEHAFGAYIFANQINNYFWEEGAGALSKKDSMLELFEKAHGYEKANYQINSHLGDGETDFVIKRYYNRYFQFKDIDGDNLEHFDIAEELEKTDVKDREQLLEIFYGSEKIDSDHEYALLLTECFANLSIMSWEEQLLSYKYLVDFFLFDYKLLVKPHPDDLMYYELEFSECEVIRKKFPAELLPFIFLNKPSVVATSSSTSIYGLRRQFENVLEFDFEFSHKKMFNRLNKYYIALAFADMYVKKGYKLGLLGVNTPIVDNFYSYNKIGTNDYLDCKDDTLSLEKKSENYVWIIDEIKKSDMNLGLISQRLEMLDEKDIVIFINSNEDFLFYDYNHKDCWLDINLIEVNTSPIDIKGDKISFAGPSLIERKEEQIYWYSKGVKNNMFKMKRELPNVGITVEGKTPNLQNMQKRILEGMLEATEKRLLYYIEHEKELKAELEEFKK